MGDRESEKGEDMASPHAPVIPEDDVHVPPDQKSVSTPTAKMYSYNSGTTPSSNVFLGGRARANFAQFRGDRAPDLEFYPTVLSNATLANHDDLDTDISLTCAKFLAMIPMPRKL